MTGNAGPLITSIYGPYSFNAFFGIKFTAPCIVILCSMTTLHAVVDLLNKFVIVLIVSCASDLPQFTPIMTGTDSDDDITLNDLLKKTHSNAAAGPTALSALATACASSAKAIVDEDDQTLATLDALKKKSMKKASDDLFDTND